MTVIAQAAVRRDIGVFEWLFDPDSWASTDGILASLGDTVILCTIVVLVATFTMVPLAAWLAHTRRGEVSVSWLVTLSRAIPTFAVAGLLVPISLRNGWGFEPWPIFIALLMLALPPIFLNTYTAIQQVDPGAVDAARAMGYSEADVLFRVELALATSVILAGVRVAAVTVVATEPIRAFLGGDGLGRYLRDGLGQNNDGLVIAGAILIAGLAGLTALSFRSVERFALPDGVRRLATTATR
ncbi:MAG: ABC transporter permease subunit [Acidimicrobiia bacterium]|nr:ABC transporter permease subunit [Acidimicrobiia bacterium]